MERRNPCTKGGGANRSATDILAGVSIRKPLRSSFPAPNAGPLVGANPIRGTPNPFHPIRLSGFHDNCRAQGRHNQDQMTEMSENNQESRNSGNSKRRRSRGGRNRNQGRNRNGGERSRNTHSSGSNRVEEFRPKQRGPRKPKPKPLTWWQKLLKAIGLYKQPEPAPRGRKSTGDRKARDSRTPKSNTRIARSGDELSDDAPSEPREDRGSSKPKRPKRRPERARGGDASTVESCRVYVGNLSYEANEEDLKELFKGVGGVRSVEIVYNRSTHRSKGYGFIEMLHQDEAVRAVEVLHDQHFMGRKLVVSGAKNRGQDDREDQETRDEKPMKFPTLASLPEKKETEQPAADAPAEAKADAPAEQPAPEAAPQEPTIETIVETPAAEVTAPTPATEQSPETTEQPKAEAAPVEDKEETKTTSA